jgi:uncharacterized protein
MLELSARQLDLLRGILAQHVTGRDVRASGSRMAGRAKPHSDLDLVVIDVDPVPDPVRAELAADLDESDLPFRVDVLFWSETPPRLRDAIKSDSEPVISISPRERCYRPVPEIPHGHVRLLPD